MSWYRSVASVRASANGKPLMYGAVSPGSRLAMVAFGVVLLGGCVHPPAAPTLGSGSTPIIRGGTNLTNAYRLSPGDDVLIRFQTFSDLNDETVIGPDNNVSLQYVHTVALGGKTLPDATNLLNAEFSKHIQEPDIAITVKSYALQEIYVEGQVNSPGLVRDTVPLTLSHAIAEAGGLKTSTAVTRNVLLVRRAPDGSIVYYKIDMSNGVAGPTVDPLLDSYDLVYVPEKNISQVAEFIGNNLLKMVPYSFSAQENP